MVLESYWSAMSNHVDIDDQDRALPNSERDMSHIRAALNGDENAFERLVEIYQPTIAKMMWKFTRDASYHHELTHDVFVKAYFNLKNFKGKAPFEHWLRRIATRTGLDFWRKRSKENQRLEILQEEWAIINQEDQSNCDPEQAGLLLQKLLSQLSPRNRIVLTLLYWDNNSVSKTAELLGWSQSMVKVQAFRARKKLKNLMKGIQ